MKILETQSATLTNYEVLKHLETIHSTTPEDSNSNNATTMKSGNLETVVKELTDYLLLTPRSPLSLSQQNPYTSSTIPTLLSALKPYDLTKAELLMILNLRPDNPGVLDCIVEELDQRFSEEEVGAILGVVGDVLGKEDGEGGEEGGEGG
ncbi:hypothetical protein MMC16_003461 [Acarospora aff. strigata]|nr:hypothetical protein [Acarospora aff. strigata]